MEYRNKIEIIMVSLLKGAKRKYIKKFITKTNNEKLLLLKFKGILQKRHKLFIQYNKKKRVNAL